MTNVKPCPECGQANLFATPTKSGGRYGPMLLPNLGSLFTPAEFTVVVCGDCGLTRFFASEEARGKLPAKRIWRKL